MTRKTILSATALIATLTFSTLANAEPYRPFGAGGFGSGHPAGGYGYYGRHVDERQARQDTRIARGTHAGQISPRERFALEGDQARIREMERRARLDGRIDPFEAREIAQAQNMASRRIAMARHNGEGRWGWRRWYHRWW